MGMLKYTNGVGHLIMSVAFAVIGTLIIILPTDPTIKGLGVTLLLTVSGAWFIPGAAKQVAYEVQKQLPPAPAPVESKDTIITPIVKG